MAKIIEYVDIPDDKVTEFKNLLSKTHGNSEWMHAHSERTGIQSMDAFFVNLPTGTAMIGGRDPKESLDQGYQSDHPDDKSHLEEAMKIFGMTEADLAALDELEFEQVVEFKAD